MAVAALIGTPSALALSQQPPPPPVGGSSKGPAGRAAGPGLQQVLRVFPSVGGPMLATLWVTDTTKLEKLANAARDSIRVLDSLTNDRSEYGDVAAINRAAGGDPVHVSPQTLALLAQARRAWLASGRLYDPTSGPIAEALNFEETVGRVPGARELDSLRALVDFGAVEISNAALTVRLPRRGMKLELDAIARGAAMDIARRVLRDRSVRAGLLRSGWYTAVFGRPVRNQGWSLTVTTPRSGRPAIGAINLDSGVIVTASDSARILPVTDRHMRLVNLRTGALAEGTSSVIVIGNSGAEAGALASALYVMGVDRARKVADSLHVAAVVIREPALNTPIGRDDVFLSGAAERVVALIRELRTKVTLVPRPPATAKPEAP
jgi:FAD:protein FMN transferase